MRWGEDDTFAGRPFFLPLFFLTLKKAVGRTMDHSMPWVACRYSSNRSLARCSSRRGLRTQYADRRTKFCAPAALAASRALRVATLSTSSASSLVPDRDARHDTMASHPPLRAAAMDAGSVQSPATTSAPAKKSPHDCAALAGSRTTAVVLYLWREKKGAGERGPSRKEERRGRGFGRRAPTRINSFAWSALPRTRGAGELRRLDAKLSRHGPPGGGAARPVSRTRGGRTP